MVMSPGRVGSGTRYNPHQRPASSKGSGSISGPDREGNPNKGEASHALAQAVYAHRQGRFAGRNLEHRVSGLNLLITAIAYWNTMCIERAKEKMTAEIAAVIRQDNVVYT